jgi:hypothetical protein
MIGSKNWSRTCPTRLCWSNRWWLLLLLHLDEQIVAVAYSRNNKQAPLINGQRRIGGSPLVLKNAIESSEVHDEIEIFGRHCGHRPGSVHACD